ncbi:hypothetical protein [Kitasatospora aureofaciens]|uniref:hypothetical protein n=1 Tax=Kitasatospora aureofaciens TaxID=1894 RepID=UPI0033D55481
MWLSGYVVLPIAGLHKPIWTYDAKTLGDDLTAHLAYGVGTSSAFWLLSRASVFSRQLQSAIRGDGVPIVTAEMTYRYGPDRTGPRCPNTARPV